MFNLPPEPQEPVVYDSYVTFTAEEERSSLGLTKLGTNQTLEYSTDTTTWNAFDTTTNISLNNGDKVYVRGILSADNTSSNYTRFKMSGKIAASGNCNAILNYEDLNAPLKIYCGEYMFWGCTALITPLELPATELANSCYSYMFWKCDSLTTSPELPATKLADWCYDGMFRGCKSLTTTPELPATTLVDGCYQNMFQECTSLTTAPELPATKLADSCYNFMFHCRASLNHIKCLATDISASSCTSNWVYNVSSTGTFVKHPDMNTWASGIHGIPEGWTVVDAEL